MTADHDLEARFQISFWDALVVQAAQASGAEILYSEDLSDEQAYGAVLVINPLRAGVLVTRFSRSHQSQMESGRPRSAESWSLSSELVFCC